ncbi:MAG: cysteine desulfurase [Deltaproteobacteria bacterium]|nr:cysteine desulfurase [Deltaproteobacteria bacterium]
MRRVYLDNNATTPIHPGLYSELKPFFEDLFGNPSSIHWAGKAVRDKLEEARSILAMFIGAKENEIIFTGSGTESSNLAIKGVALANRDRGNHIITTQVEHPCVLNTLRYLESKGFEVTYLPVDRKGQLDPDDVKRAIRKDTILITVMYANNETGTVLPIGEIGNIAKEKGIYFHSDMVQALGKVKLDLKDLKVDLASFSGHKTYAPKGIGFLYVRDGTKNIHPIIHGGHQERGLRAGTENTIGIVAMGLVASNLAEEIDLCINKMENLRRKIISGLIQSLDGITLNGDQENRLPNTINVSFEGINASSLVSLLDGYGIAVSSGAACRAKEASFSHVLQAMGLPPSVVMGAIRISVGRYNTDEEIDYAIPLIVKAVKTIRED